MHCVGQFTWCWSLWEKGDHPSHYFISSLTLSHRCTHMHARTHTHMHAHTRAHTFCYLSLPPCLSVPLFCGPVLSWLLFQTAAAAIKQLQTESRCAARDKQGGIFFFFFWRKRKVTHTQTQRKKRLFYFWKMSLFSVWVMEEFTVGGFR